jgi:hypothetical protein
MTGDVERSMSCSGVRGIFRTCTRVAVGEKCGHWCTVEKQGRHVGDGLSKVETGGGVVGEWQGDPLKLVRDPGESCLEGRGE